METESGVGTRNEDRAGFAGEAETGLRLGLDGIGAEARIVLGVRLDLVFEAESEIGSRAKFVERVHIGSGTEFGDEVGGRARLQLHLGLSLNLVMNLELRLRLNWP